jgi:hypothetical protein
VGKRLETKKAAQLLITNYQLLSMLDDFIQQNLAHVDDLSELKVSLVALRLLEQKVSPAPSITERELMQQPAIRDGLSFAAISLRPALQRAVARGTLLCAQVGEGEPRYFVNDEGGRRAVEVLSEPALDVKQDARAHDALMLALAREVERLELIDAYAISDEECELVKEWLARGYAEAEMLAAIQASLHEPRRKQAPHRTLKDCTGALIARPPAEPTEYYRVVIARSVKPVPEEIMLLRERMGRWPNAREFEQARTAVGLFGRRVALDAMKRAPLDGVAALDSVIAALAEQEAAALALQRNMAGDETEVREMAALYEQTFGVPPTGVVMDEMRLLRKDAPDMGVWRGAFAYAIHQNKRSWAYVRKIIQNPSADVYAPQPAGATATFAFAEYKKRVNRVLDASVAREINDLAVKIDDTVKWTAAFDKAAAANALRWDYIKKVLSSMDEPADKNHGRKKPAAKQNTGRQRGNTFRRPQATYSDEERAAAEERARQRAAQRAGKLAGESDAR